MNDMGHSSSEEVSEPEDQQLGEGDHGHHHSVAIAQLRS